MWNAEKVVAELTRRGELAETARGLIMLRGDVLQLYQQVDRALRALALRQGAEEWLLPMALPLETLARADYFASFPQWLTMASHLGGDSRRHEAVALAADPVRELRSVPVPAAAALQPAVCYHVYAALADRSLEQPVCVTCAGTCWRHEGDRLAPLERGWSFTMREIVRVGDQADVSRFLAGQRAAAVAFAHRLGLVADIEPATDPFFAPASAGRAALQRIKGLKDELLLPVGSGRTVAAASFNHHEWFFGSAFNIRLRDGKPAGSGCAAFGLERWLLAALVAWGVDSARWPDVESSTAAAPRPYALRVAAG